MQWQLYLKITVISLNVHNNKIPQEFVTQDFICSLTLRPVIPVTAWTARIRGSVTGLHLNNKSSGSREAATIMTHTEINNFNYYMDAHASVHVLKVWKWMFPERKS